MEEIDAVTVDAEVAVGWERGDFIAPEGDGGAREIEGVAEAIEGQLDYIGVGDEFGIIERTTGGDHGEGLIIAESAG